MRHDDPAGLSAITSRPGLVWRTFGLISCLSTLSLAACSGDNAAGGAAGGTAVAPGAGGTPQGGQPAASGGAPAASGGSANFGGSTPAAARGQPSAGGASPSSSGGTPGFGGSLAGGSTSVAGSGAGLGGSAAGGSAAGGSPTTTPGGGAGASSSGGTPATTGGSGGSHSSDHCVSGFDPHPTDATIKDGPAEFTKSNQIDLTVQPEVIAWMDENRWQAAHFEWHNIRRCMGGMGTSKVNICSFKQLIPTNQECKTTGDGYEFMVMHRHMIQSLKQLWPQHKEQFEGWTKFPQSAQDVPQQWRADFKAWSADQLAKAKIADEIDKPENLAKFPDEGAFGWWLQCFAGSTVGGVSEKASGLHGDLHFKWVRPSNTSHGLGNQERNIDNYMFWKMHGWLDNVWEKYRKAKGLAPDEPKLKAALVQQCREMDTYANIIKNNLKPGDNVNPTPTPTNETGFFHTQVRPLFESNNNKCTGCHNKSGADAGLTLGGEDVSSASVIAALVNKPSHDGGQFKLVVPGNPDQSWLYLKAAGKAASAGCTVSSSAQCITQVMPPNSDMKPTMTESELAILRKWIQDGATTN